MVTISTNAMFREDFDDDLILLLEAVWTYLIIL